MTLRPYQQAGLERFMARPDKRLIAAWATSAGKSLFAIRCGEALNARRILVVCPAIARPTWVREFAKWAPSYTPGAIRFGRKRKLTKAHDAERESAYLADVQVVSYKLLKELEASPRDLLILDELHALRSPLSQQSKIVRAFRGAYPKLPMLGLTATLIPTEVRQLWCPLDTFWPGQWGRKHPAGDVSWDFQAHYCHREENEYGVRYVGARSPEALATLALRLAPFIHRVTDQEVAPFLPPLHAEPLYLDEVRQEEDVAADWLDDAVEAGATHVVIAAFNREVARRIASKLDTEYVVTGEDTPEKRDAILLQAKMAPRATVVATSEAIRESISLSFASRVLLFQWRTSPAQALQLMGRFRRQDAVDLVRPAFIQYVVVPGDESRAETLMSRIRDVQAIMGKSANEELLQEVFKPRPITEEVLDNMFAQMMSSVRVHSDWADDEL